MKVEFNTNTEEIKSGSLVRLDGEYYGIYLTDMNGENPIIYDLEDDQYYTDVELYNIEPVIGDVKLIVE